MEWLGAAEGQPQDCVLSSTRPGALRAKAGLATGVHSLEDETQLKPTHLRSASFSHVPYSSPLLPPNASTWFSVLNVLILSAAPAPWTQPSGHTRPRRPPQHPPDLSSRHALSFRPGHGQSRQRWVGAGPTQSLT